MSDFDHIASLYQPLQGSEQKGEMDTHDDPPFDFEYNGEMPMLDGDSNKDGLKIAILDDFFRDAYIYHRYHGYTPYLMRIVRKFVVSTCSVLIFFFLSLCVNWENIGRCGRGQGTDYDKACAEIFGLVSGPHWFLVMINVLFFLYLGWLLYATLEGFKMARRMNIFYTNVLKISPEMIAQGITWQAVVDRIVSYHRSGQIPDIRKGISSEIIASYIMRHDNFLTALIQNDLLNIRRHKNIWYSRPLILVVENFIVKYISQQQRMKKNEAFLFDVEGFQKWINILSIISLVALPFILAYHVLMGFISIMQHLAGRGDTSTAADAVGGSVHSPYRWSGYAKIKLRKHNEINHLRRLRLQESAECAETAIRCYPTYFVKELIHMIAFPVTFLTGFIIFFSLNDTGMLFNISVFNRPLMFYLTIFGLATYVCRDYLASFHKNMSIHKISMENKKKLIERLVFTGLTTLTNVQSTHSAGINKKIFQVSQDLQELYKHRLQLFFEELVGIICLPYVLRFVIYENAGGILNFLNKRAQVDKDIGVVCSPPLDEILPTAGTVIEEGVKVVFQPPVVDTINDIPIREV